MKTVILSFVILGATAKQTLDQTTEKLISQAEGVMQAAEKPVADFLKSLDTSKQDLHLKPSTVSPDKETAKPEKACYSNIDPQKKKSWTPSSDQLLIFVSSSLPSQSLQRLSQDAAKIGAKLIFRGLINDSFKDTQLYFAEIGIQAEIDPTKFDDYHVKMVPTFILTNAEARDQLQGHVSVAEALSQFKDQGDLKKEAAQLLHILGDQF